MPKYDTHIELKPIAEQNAAQRGTFTYGYTKHIAVKGFQKMITKWTKLLLTTEGSDLSDRTLGTAFPLLLGSNVTSREDVQHIAHSAVSKASADVRRIQTQNPPEDLTEVFHSAKITSLIFEDKASVSVYVLLQNQAGKRLQVILAGSVQP